MKRELILTQEDAEIGIGNQYLPIYELNEDGEKVKRGVAVYDLGDEQLIYNFSQMQQEMQDLIANHIEKLKGFDNLKDISSEKNKEKLKELYQVNITGINAIFECIDRIFGEGFCKRAMGDSKNIQLLVKIISYIGEDIAKVRSGKVDNAMNKYGKKKKAGDA